MKSIHALFGVAIVLLASSLLYGQSLAPSFGPPPLEPPEPIVGPSSGTWPSQEWSAPQSATTYSPPPLSTGNDVLADNNVLIDVESDCEAVPLYTTRLALGITFADYELSDEAGTYWTIDPVFVARNEVSLESPDGIGLRLQSWSVDDEWNIDDGKFEARVATVYLDVFRRFVGEEGELLLGGGLAYGSLKINSPFDDTTRRFNGLGGSLAGEGFYPLLRFEQTDIGVIGRARLSLLGPLDDNFDDSQAMLVDEVGIGLELRHRYGKHQERMWFVRVARDYQYWSDVNAPFSIDQRVEATSFTVGFAW